MCISYYILWYPSYPIISHDILGGEIPDGQCSAVSTRRCPWCISFEPIDLTPDSIMQRAGVPMLYDSASNPPLPCLYSCPVANVLACAPQAPRHSVLHRRQQSPHQGRSAYWTRLSRHAVGPGQRQQALRGEHLVVYHNILVWYHLCKGLWVFLAVAHVTIQSVLELLYSLARFNTP